LGDGAMDKVITTIVFILLATAVLFMIYLIIKRGRAVSDKENYILNGNRVPSFCSVVGKRKWLGSSKAFSGSDYSERISFTYRCDDAQNDLSKYICALASNGFIKMEINNMIIDGAPVFLVKKTNESDMILIAELREFSNQVSIQISYKKGYFEVF